MPRSNARKRIKVIASTEGIERAESALIRHGFGSRDNFAKSKLLGKNSVTKFFHQEPIQLNTFMRICEGLQIDWREMLEPSSVNQEKAEPAKMLEGIASLTSSGAEPVQTVSRQLAVTNQQNETVVIVLKGNLDSVNTNFKETLEVLLKNYAGATIQITDIEAGSIRVAIQGSQEDVVKLIKLIESGELAELSGFPIEAIEIASRKLLEDANITNSSKKWELAQQIVEHPHTSRNLQGADLSDADLSDAFLRSAVLIGADLRGADLSHADLSRAILDRAVLSRADLRGAILDRAILDRAILIGADLRGADLRGADLSDADLSHADLIGADLSDADLIGANLRHADLSGANLSGANLENAIVKRANFIGSQGLSRSERLDLIERGAIFDDALGDHESVNSPTRPNSPVRR